MAKLNSVRMTLWNLIIMFLGIFLKGNRAWRIGCRVFKRSLRGWMLYLYLFCREDYRGNILMCYARRNYYGFRNLIRSGLRWVTEILLSSILKLLSEEKEIGLRGCSFKMELGVLMNLY